MILGSPAWSVVAGAALGAVALAASGCGGASNPDLGLGGGDDGGTNGSDGALGQDGSRGTDGSNGSDGGTPGDTGGVGFCASLTGTHVFCDDFDTSVEVKSKWDTQLLVGPSSARLDTAVVRSPPNAYLAATTATSQGAVSVVQKTLPQDRGYVLLFDARIDAYGADPNRQQDFGSIAGLAMGPFSVGLVVVAPGVAGVVEQFVADGGTDTRTYHALSSALGTNRWIRVEMAVVYPSTAAGHLRVRLDGVTVLDTALTSAAAPPSTSVFSLGLYVGDAPNAWTAHFDNVVVDKP